MHTKHPLVEQSHFCENQLQKQGFSLPCYYKRETLKTTKMSISIWTFGFGKTNFTYPHDEMIQYYISINHD